MALESETDTASDDEDEESDSHVDKIVEAVWDDEDTSERKVEIKQDEDEPAQIKNIT